MINRRTFLIIVFIFIVASIIKETGLLELYEKLARYVMVWVVPSLFEESQATGTVTLVLYIPLIFVGVVVAGVFRILRDKRMRRKQMVEGYVER